MGMIVLNAGFFTTIQDMGRLDFQDRGVPQSGMLDRLSGSIANILVGNCVGTGLIEMMVMAGEFRFTQNNVIAITGANVIPFLNGNPCPRYQAFCVRAGDTLSFGSMQGGAICYLAVAGGFELTEVMGSCSTYVRGGIGGIHGDRLKQGNTLTFADPKETLPNMEARGEFPDQFRQEVKRIGVILGPQEDAFTEKGITTFFNETYTISGEYDRMGCRLEGEVIEHVKDANILSDGIVFGAVQIPGHGMPIIMLSDRQTVGGYTKLGVVASADLPKLVQSLPGQKIAFHNVTVTEAQESYIAMQNRLANLKKRIERGVPFLNVSINGKMYQVTVEER